MTSNLLLTFQTCPTINTFHTIPKGRQDISASYLLSNALCYAEIMTG